jgi:HK97 family phage major capsid protein
MPTLTDARETARDLSTKALAIAEDQVLTMAEKATKLDVLEADIKSALADVQTLERFEEHRKNFEATLGGSQHAAGDQKAEKGLGSIGEQFADSAGLKSAISQGLQGNWTTGSVDLKGVDFGGRQVGVKTTVTEGTAGTQGPGGALVYAAPQVVPGIVGQLFQELTISDLIPQGTTSSPLIRYLVESAVTNAAATTAEGGLKPESALTFAKVDESVQKIATFLPVSDEMLEDYEQIVSYLNGRLPLFVKLAEETQLLLGDGTGTNLVGLMNRSGKQTTIVKGTAPSVAGDNDMDVVYRQITAVRVGSFLEPDAVVFDPTGWQTIQLSKASGTGNYFAGGPFLPAGQQSIWGKKAVVTTRMTAGAALVGAFGQAAQVFRKGGLRVEASNSHADFFQRDLTAIRAEERLALAVYRPGAFGVVTGL